MTPPAPPRFSITTVWPRFSDSAGTTLRVTMSVPPPGAAGTTRRIGRVGYCADAGAARSPQTSSAMNLVTVHLHRSTTAGLRPAGDGHAGGRPYSGLMFAAAGPF